MAKKNKSFFKYALLAISCVFTFSLVSAWIAPAQAKIIFIPPGTEPPKTDTTSTAGGSSRGNSCKIGQLNNNTASVVKLLPQSNIGLTLKQRPSIMVYVAPTTARKLFFSIQDEDENNYYETTLRLDRNTGVMQVRLPASAPRLVSGKKYQYTLATICGEDYQPEDYSVSGWIQRVQLSENLQYQQPSLELASKLAMQGIWYDALSTLAIVKKSQPSNQSVANSWQQLLQSAGLSQISREPIVN